VTFNDFNKVLADLDDFIDSDCARWTFTMQCDLRELQWPPFDCVLSPERMEKWRQYNTMCTLINQSGMQCWPLKAILIPILHVCQPACRVYLLADSHICREDSIIFDPCQPTLTQGSACEEQLRLRNEQAGISEILNTNSFSDSNDAKNLPNRPSSWRARPFKDYFAGIKTSVSDQGMVPAGATFSEWRLHAAQDTAAGKACLSAN